MKKKTNKLTLSGGRVINTTYTYCIEQLGGHMITPKGVRIELDYTYQMTNSLAAVEKALAKTSGTDRRGCKFELDLKIHDFSA